MPHRRIRAHYKQKSEFERDHSIGLKEAGWMNRTVIFDILVEVMRCLDVTSKSGSTTTDIISVRMAMVDLGPQQNRKTERLLAQLL